MATGANEAQEGPPLDLDRIFDAFERHGVSYLLVGGLGAQRHGAKRKTYDLDCVVRQDGKNLGKVAAALRELGARLRVAGMSDEEARQLPVLIDARTLEGNKTWRTDAGDIDTMAEIPKRTGGKAGYDELVGRALVVEVGQNRVVVAALDDIISSKERIKRPKDLEALPELYELRDGLKASGARRPSAGIVARGPSAGPGRGQDEPPKHPLGPAGRTAGPGPDAQLGR